MKSEITAKNCKVATAAEKKTPDWNKTKLDRHDTYISEELISQSYLSPRYDHTEQINDNNCPKLKNPF